jgi:hypothetical protein
MTRTVVSPKNIILKLILDSLRKLYELDCTYSGSYPMVSFGIDDVEPLVYLLD